MITMVMMHGVLNGYQGISLFSLENGKVSYLYLSRNTELTFSSFKVFLEL